MMLLDRHKVVAGQAARRCWVGWYCWAGWELLLGRQMLQERRVACCSWSGGWLAAVGAAGGLLQLERRVAGCMAGCS